MIWSALARGIYWGIGAVQAVGEAFGSARRLVRQARQGTIPSVDDTDPIPLGRSSGQEFRTVSSGRYDSTLAEAKPRPFPRKVSPAPRR